jgi:hypothetical protein
LEETQPREITTVPSYLHTHVTDASFREALDRYVACYSVLYRRGTIIANLMAQNVCGPAPPPPLVHQLPAPREEPVQALVPAITPGAMEPFRQFVDMLMGPEAQPWDDVTAGPIKQVFYPERWPTETQCLDPRVQAVLEEDGRLLPGLCGVDPTGVMVNTGWDNVLNSMATKFFANTQVLVKHKLAQRVGRFLGLPGAMDEASPALSALLLLTGPLRPVILHNDDHETVVRLRRVVGVPDDDPLWYPKRNAKFSRDMFELHLFLTRHGCATCSYLPHAAKTRKFAYLDAKVFRCLRAQVDRAARAARKAAGGLVKRKKQVVAAVTPPAEEAGGGGAASASAVPADAGGDSPDEVSTGTESLGQLMGVTPAQFNARRTALRRQLRRQGRAVRSATTRSAKLARRWDRLGSGRMPSGGRIDSAETNGVGLRLAVKVVKLDMTRFVRPLPTREEADAAASEVKLSKAQQRARKKQLLGAAEPAAPPRSRYGADGAQPIWVGVDLGVKKLIVAAVSHDVCLKPATFVFTSSRFYSEMGYHRHEKWEKARRLSTPDVAATLDALAQAAGARGGLRCANSDTWREHLLLEKQHEQLIHDEYVADAAGRCKQKEVLFRKKRSSLARACTRLLDSALVHEPAHGRRLLILGVGQAGFASSSRGNMAAPTTSLDKALHRAGKVMQSQRPGQEVLFLTVDEHKTTVSCCGCGHDTTKAILEGGKSSGRLRSCTQCNDGGNKLRDRDVQAARNMLWLAQHMYFGLDRPEYMCRSRTHTTT